MKKNLCLTTILLLLTVSTVTFAESQVTELNKVRKVSTLRTFLVQKDFKQCVNFIGLSKDDILNEFFEKPILIEDGGLQYFNSGIILNFTNNGKGIVKSIFVEKDNVDFNGVHVGDKISDFKKQFTQIIDEDKVEGYCSFAYEGKKISAFYDIATKRVLYVYIAQHIMQTTQEDNINVVKFIDNINGVYFGNNINYKLAETGKDAKIEAAISEVYNLKAGTDHLNYYYNYVDLNHDGKNEVFVYLRGSLVSGSGGDSAVIFSDIDGQYKLLSRFTLVHNPIIISNNTTNGWHDIIMPVAGGGSESFFAEIKFDGKEYPMNPSVQPRLTNGRVVVGTAIIADNINSNQGIQF